MKAKSFLYAVRSLVTAAVAVAVGTRNAESAHFPSISAARRGPNALVFEPAGVATGNGPQLKTRPFAPFTLNQDDPLATLDYGVERAGYPFFEISELTGLAQIEVKYTEAFDGLNKPFSDGPFGYSNQLGNTFRVETFNITSTGTIASPLVQGGQKWQSIRLLTGGSVSFSTVGFEASIDTIEVEQLPGRFTSDDVTLYEIWILGARAATAACFDRRSQRAIWEVGPVDGVLARSTRPSLSYHGFSWGNYTLEFDTKIEKGGSWWAVVGISPD